MHHLPSFKNSYNACNILSVAAEEKTGSFFSLPKKPKMFAGGRWGANVVFQTKDFFHDNLGTPLAPQVHMLQYPCPLLYPKNC
jgi:hypothetical protein